MSKDKEKKAQAEKQPAPKKTFDFETALAGLKTEENTATIEEIQAEISHLKVENDVLKDEVKYQVAEMRNVLRRRDEQETNLRKYGSAQLGELIIPDVELLKQVLASLEQNDNQELRNYLMGFEMVIKKIETSLETVGIVPMKTVVGSEFNPQLEESVEQVETDQYKSGEVVEIVHHGYMIKDRVLLHAKVKVAK
jgi:molecular chaperone GrpE